MPKVQRVTSSVEAVAPNVNLPRVGVPRVPSPVRGAFGEDQAAAGERLGRTITQAAGRGINVVQDVESMKQRAAERMAIVKSAEIENNFLKGMQDIEYGAGEVTKKDSTGKERLVPRGTKLRLGYDALDSTEDLQNALVSLSDNLLKDIPDGEYKDGLRQRLLRHSTSTRESQILYAARQLQDADKKTFAARNETAINAVEPNSESLKRTVKNLAEYHREEQMRFGESDEVTAYKTHDDVERAVRTAAMDLLSSTGDLAEAKKLAAEHKDYLFSTNYKNIEKKLEALNASMEADIKRKKTIATNQSRYDVLSGMADGSINYRNSDSFIKAVATTDPDLAEAMSRVFRSTRRYKADEAKNKDFQRLTGEMFRATDAKSMTDYLVNVVKENPNISQDRLSILVDAARMRGDSLPAAKEYRWEQQKQNFFDSAIMALKGGVPPLAVWDVFSRVIKRFKNEKTPDEAMLNVVNDEVRKQRLIDNPSFSQLPEEGHLFVDRFGNKAIVYPDGTYEEVMDAEGNVKSKKPGEKRERK